MNRTRVVRLNPETRENTTYPEFQRMKLQETIRFGEMRLRDKKDALGKRLSPAALAAVQQAVDNAQRRLDAVQDNPGYSAAEKKLFAMGRRLKAGKSAEPQQYRWVAHVEFADDGWSGPKSAFEYFDTEARAKAYKTAQLKSGAQSVSIRKEIGNPGAEFCGGRKPASDVTDRALRYRANTKE